MRCGFSLVELSIVLVILGLLAGGVLSGQSLIRAAELRSVGQSVDKYRTAVYTFRDKYFSLPGDMSNATQFWGAADADATTCKSLTTASSDKKTCDGNGDGSIGVAYSPTTNVSDYYERFRVWQHLANAGLIEGQYSGVTGNGGAMPAEQPIVGVNVPKGKISNTGFTFYNIPSHPDVAKYFAGPTGNYLFFGSAGSNVTGNPVLTPEEQWNIDVKLDDGKASYGFIQGLPSSNPVGGAGCTSTASSATAAYILDSKEKACSMLIQPGF